MNDIEIASIKFVFPSTAKPVIEIVVSIFKSVSKDEDVFEISDLSDNSTVIGPLSVSSISSFVSIF